MPTGYTAAIADGISFEKFVWSCARAMGALILMRDDPSDAPIPQCFEPSNTYKEWGDDARAEMARLQAMNIEEVEAAAEAAYNAALASTRDGIAKATELRDKYEQMLEKVRAWTPPTPDHERFREFMVEQIEESIRFDCGTDYYTAPARVEPTTWHNQQISRCQDRIARYDAEHAEEVERTESRNAWIQALRDSVPPA